MTHLIPKLTLLATIVFSVWAEDANAWWNTKAYIVIDDSGQFLTGTIVSNSSASEWPDYYGLRNKVKITQAGVQKSSKNRTCWRWYVPVFDVYDSRLIPIHLECRTSATFAGLTQGCNYCTVGITIHKALISPTLRKKPKPACDTNSNTDGGGS